MIEFIRLFNNEACPDNQHTLETILTLSSAKPNSIVLIAKNHSSLIEQFQQKINERYEAIQSLEEHQVSFYVLKSVSILILF